MIMAANPQPSGSTWGIHLQGGEDPKAPQTPSETLGGDLRGAGGRGKGGRPIPPACTEDPHGRPALSCACHGQCPALAPHTPWATPAPSCNLASRTHCSFSSMLAQQFLPHLLAVSSNTWRPQTLPCHHCGLEDTCLTLVSREWGSAGSAWSRTCAESYPVGPTEWTPAPRWAPRAAGPDHTHWGGKALQKPLGSH